MDQSQEVFAARSNPYHYTVLLNGLDCEIQP